jgi:hypothetical protein
MKEKNVIELSRIIEEENQELIFIINGAQARARTGRLVGYVGIQLCKDGTAETMYIPKSKKERLELMGLIELVQQRLGAAIEQDLGDVVIDHKDFLPP